MEDGFILNALITDFGLLSFNKWIKHTNANILNL
ncbi:hypothetical protein B0I27_103301 [Arcticibacter pallidicorallinus]|uniref:Uncharacterized protein n=1 Tax=Arcticibacter pallidicorallinus TaxID=1259464 RepID=A0A2T0U7J0_9SPHI|nr:hypothetical protein B0I27_103301 [Arcticibacter pallidicorallinus]